MMVEWVRWDPWDRRVLVDLKGSRGERAALGPWGQKVLLDSRARLDRLGPLALRGPRARRVPKAPEVDPEKWAHRDPWASEAFKVNRDNPVFKVSRDLQGLMAQWVGKVRQVNAGLPECLALPAQSVNRDVKERSALWVLWALRVYQEQMENQGPKASWDLRAFRERSVPWAHQVLKGFKAPKVLWDHAVSWVLKESKESKEREGNTESKESKDLKDRKVSRECKVFRGPLDLKGQTVKQASM